MTDSVLPTNWQKVAEKALETLDPLRPTQASLEDRAVAVAIIRRMAEKLDLAKHRAQTLAEGI